MAAIGSYFLVDGIPRNGATVKLWSSGAAFLTTPPQKNTALPLTGSYVQTTTTGTTHGGDGAYRFTGVTAGVYYVSIEWNSLIVYDTWEIPTSGTPTGVASVKAYGALGDGVTNDTTALQAALDDTAVGLLYFPPGTYLTGTINISSRGGLVLEGTGATIKYTGTGSTSAPIGLRIAGTCRDLTIRNLKFTGSGTASHYHCGVQMRDATTCERLAIRDCHFDALSVGIWLNRTSSGDWEHFVIEGNFFEQALGTGTTQGLGIRVNNTGAGMFRSGLKILGNSFYSQSRHDIEIVECTGVTIKGNQFRSHRGAIASGTQFPSVLLTDVEEGIVADNTWYDAADGMLSIIPNTGIPVGNLQISGNVFSLPLTDVAGVTLGSTTPAGNGNLQNVAFVNNQFRLNGRAAAALVLDSGVRVRIAGNVIEHLSVPSGTRSAIHLSGSGDSGGTRTYNDDIQVEGNLLYGTAGAGTFVGINLASAFCTSIGRAVFRGNRVRGGNMFASGTTITNDRNLQIIDQEDDGISMSAGTELEFVERGPTRYEGARQIQTREITADRTLDHTDEVIFCDCTAGAIICTLPTVVGNSGLTYTIVKTDASANGVGITPQGGQTIQTLSSWPLVYKGQSVTVKAIGTTTWLMTAVAAPPVTAYGLSISTARTLLLSDTFVAVDTSGGNVTITLPSLATSHGKVYFLFKPSAANDMVIDGNGAETVSGSATQTCQAADGALNLTVLTNNLTDWLFAYRTWT